MPLSGKKVLVILTGGIACYKVPYLVRYLTKSGAEVRVLMTDNAAKFIAPLTLEAVSKNPVNLEMFPDGKFVATRHIELAGWPDLVVVAPATANFIARSTAGICDDLVSTIICATDRPVLLAPAMNPNMWINRITQRNFDFLKKEMKWQSIGPNEGEMAEDQWGVGRMAEPNEIFERVLKLLGTTGGKKKTTPAKKKALEGKKIIVTAGPCREPIDPVRYISNRSSGKMGYAIARAAAQLGADVTLVSGPTDLTHPDGLKFIPVERTTEMYRAVSSRFKRCDCLIMAAAPADFEPISIAKQKLKKGLEPENLQLRPTVDILASLAPRKRADQIMIGFALETENGVANARKKLKKKNLDLVFLNNPTDNNSAFEHDTNMVTIIRHKGRPEKWPLMHKDDLAYKLLLELLLPLL